MLNMHYSPYHLQRRPFCGSSRPGEPATHVLGAVACPDCRNRLTDRLLLLESLLYAANNVGLETECATSPPCQACRACAFQIARMALR